MQRKFRKTLLNWKNHPLRTPLIVRGARQVGKTFTIQAFGEAEFKNVHTINFELAPKFQSCFEDLDPQAIISQIELISRQKIIPQESLLFFDEIQQCPKALQSLRYFKEKMPDLHVIAAGSLLEFAMRDTEFSFPVGRVQFARLYPLSFEEYLEACGDTALKDSLYTFNCSSPPPISLHNHLLERVREYTFIGGMPAAVMAYLKTHSLIEVQYSQKSLWDAYESDFGKYARQAQHQHLKRVFEKVPTLIGDHVKYNRINPELPNPARDIKQAIELLHLAGLLHYITATSAGSIPLLSCAKENIFKLLFLDIGMVVQKMSADLQYSGIIKGPLSEQFVGQEFLAAADPLLDTNLFFWIREKGTAEVDYLIAHKGIVYPIEVKAGKSGKLKSLQIFLQEKKSPFGIKISEEPLEYRHHILSIPFYLASHLNRLIDDVAHD